MLFLDIFLGTLKRLHGFVCSRADTVQSCGHAAFATVDDRSDVGRLVLRKRLRSIAAAVGARRLGVAEAPTALHAEAPSRAQAMGQGPRTGKFVGAAAAHPNYVPFVVPAVALQGVGSVESYEVLAQAVHVDHVLAVAGRVCQALPTYVGTNFFLLFLFLFFSLFLRLST